MLPADGSSELGTHRAQARQTKTNERSLATSHPLSDVVSHANVCRSVLHTSVEHQKCASQPLQLQRQPTPRACRRIGFAHIIKARWKCLNTHRMMAESVMPPHAGGYRFNKSSSPPRRSTQEAAPRRRPCSALASSKNMQPGNFRAELRAWNECKHATQGATCTCRLTEHGPEN